VKPLAVIPSYLREESDAELLRTAVNSIHMTAHRQVDVLVVDDGSPAAELLDTVRGAEIVAKLENEGFSRTVNVGLRRALEEGRNAILVNADIEFLTPGWVQTMENQLDGSGRRAAVVGALLMYPNGLIQHGGVYFSLLSRTFDHLFKYGPWNLPEALVPATRPVTAALQFIRHECLTNVGLYDEEFRMGWEDVDYCIRVFLSGRECIYQPSVRAFHHEMAFRGRPDEKVQRWTLESFYRLMSKYEGQSFAGLVPTL
jgi:GT2 family glycosyltransferase